MRNFLIKLLGGMTRLHHLEEMERLRKASEQFAKEYLCAKNGVTLQGDGFIEYADCDLDFVVTGSRTRINNCRLGGIYVAPWVERCSLICVRAGESNLLRKDPPVLHNSFIYAKDEHLELLSKASYSTYEPIKLRQQAKPDPQ